MVKPDSHIKQLLEVMLQKKKKKITEENYAKGKGGAFRDWGHGDLCLEYSLEANTLSVDVDQKLRGGEFKVRWYLRALRCWKPDLGVRVY